MAIIIFKLIFPFPVGHTANYAVVLAQLYSKGVRHGIHAFIVQLRDEETHLPMPGIKIGEIGSKLGMNTTNNGFLGFENVRIPLDRMLMKNGKILKVSFNFILKLARCKCLFSRMDPILNLLVVN